MPSVSEALAERVMDAGALKVWLFVGDVRLAEGGWFTAPLVTTRETGTTTSAYPLAMTVIGEL